MKDKKEARRRRKKYQVFVSSTYLDLKIERQAAVQAILESGHVPAGMELFTAGNQSQLEVIKKWIEESDIYLLILGPRYGSLEPETQKSYTEIEYEYAKSLGIPSFAIIISNDLLSKRSVDYINDENEMKFRNKYLDFSRIVKDRMCEFYDDVKDIKLAIHKSIKDIEHNYDLNGWVSGDQVAAIESVSAEKELLAEENLRLKKEIEFLKLNKVSRNENTKDELYNGLTFEEVKRILLKEKVPLKELMQDDCPERIHESQSLLALFKHMGNSHTSVSNAYGASKTETWMYYNIANKLLKYKLTELAKVPPSVKWQRLTISQVGYQFLAKLEGESLRKNTEKVPV